MNRRELIAAAVSLWLVSPATRGQEKRWLVGMLLPNPLTNNPERQRFIDVLASADLKPGANLMFIPRPSRGNPDRVHLASHDTVNRKIAEELGIEVPASIMLQANARLRRE